MKLSEIATKMSLDDLETAINRREPIEIVAAFEKELHPKYMQVLFASVGDDIVAIDNPDHHKILFGSKFSETRNGEIKVEHLNERFLHGEVFCLDHFQPNTGWVDDPQAPFFSHGNRTRAFRTEWIDVFRGHIDFNMSTFKPSLDIDAKIITNHLESSKTKYFYIQVTNSNEVWGPFTATGTIADATSFNLSALSSQSDIIWNFETLHGDDYLDFDVPYKGIDSSRKFVKTWLDTACAESYLFYNETKLAKWLQTKVSLHGTLTDTDRSSIKNLTTVMNDLAIDTSETLLLDRAKAFLNRTNSSLATMDDFLEAIPDTVSLRTRIQEMENHSQKIVQDNLVLTNDKNRLNDELTDLDQKKQDLKQSIAKLNENLEAITNDLATYEKEKLETHSKDLADIEEKISRKKSELVELEDRVQSTREIETLDDQISRLRQRLDGYREDERELKDSIEHLAAQFLDSQKSARQQLRNLVESKTHFDFLSGNIFETGRNEKTHTIEKVPISFFESGEDETAERKFLTAVQNSFHSCSRKFDNHFVANLLISLHQNMFTIFAGAPGTGKTSLARILSHCLIPSSRIKEISVARGWNSQTDLIGFLNPLTNRFHESNTDLFSLLAQLNHETCNGAHPDVPIAIAILDEANLSPIEHYWSVFYNLTDSIMYEDPFKLNLGGDKRIEFANNLRFIGTINTDMTTEPLSERVLDRTNIIRMPTDVDVEFSGKLNTLPAAIGKGRGLSFNEIIRLFDLPDMCTSPINENRYSSISAIKAFDVLKPELKKIGIIVNPRLQNSLRQYCFTAAKYMHEELRPLDYFINQRVLPKIDLQGGQWEGKLIDLKNVFSDLFKFKRAASVITLENILEAGELEMGFHNYNYFLLR